MRIAALDRSQLDAARAVLAEGCVFDRADVVAGEKLFGDGPKGPPLAFGAWDGDLLVGVAAVAANRVRVLAVLPASRGRGAGSALLAACEDAARAAGETSLRSLDQPGNYLAPGIDERNVETIGWLERRGWKRTAEPRENVLIDVRGNPRVTPERATELADACRARGYEIRRARRDETELLAAVGKEFGGAWPFELARALEHEPVAVHVALSTSASRLRAASDAPATAVNPGRPRISTHEASAPTSVPLAPTGDAIAVPRTSTQRGSASGPSAPAIAVPRTSTQRISTGGASAPSIALPRTSTQPDIGYCAFAAHDGNNRGLGWFGPTGTWPAHRGKGLGEALLLACLVDVAADHERCEVAWIGPRPFYEKAAGIAMDRRFVLLVKAL